MRGTRAGLLAALAFAGCGSSNATTVTREVVTVTKTAAAEPPVTKTEAATENGVCSIGRRGSSLRVSFAGPNATRYCGYALRLWSNESELWERARPLISEVGSQGRPVEACNLVKGNVSVVVETLGTDEGDSTAICGRLVHLGWEESGTE